ncbi:putative ATP-citrate synthase subunit 2 [Lachnellula arida]|uniref:ATP citrate synthase n=1 Tax=Lachnellula arida TaxID=1316785 RepID=A0A8T9BRP5_9HELO|nr:putative ATP-citrate synthase subunit 2 [Lachnellula arida]
MAAKSISEADGKAIINYHLTRAPVIKPSPLPKSSTHNAPAKLASLYFPQDAEVSAILDQAETLYPWLLVPGAKFVAKPDQLIKRRGKSGLLALNKTWPEAKAWVAARAGKPQQVETVVGVLRQFLVEPFVPHPDGTEYYININSQREVMGIPFESKDVSCVQVDIYDLLLLLGSDPHLRYNYPAAGERKLENDQPTSLNRKIKLTKFCTCICICAIDSLRSFHGDWILFTHEGGVDVGDVDAKAEKLLIPVDLSEYPSNNQIAATLLKKVPKGVHNVLVDFISRLYAVYVDSQFTYLEINPLVVIPNANATSAAVHFLDLAAKLDQTAEFECGVKWAVARSPAALGQAAVKVTDGKVNIDAGPPMEFPAPFGREMSKEEAYIAEMDAKTGASLKLTVLNPNGRVWTLVAGGGASVVYADAIASSGFADELANYDLHYARTVIDLMLRAPITPQGKVLFIGGGIANFTNVASTFKGVIRALKEYSSQLLEHKVQIWVRRAGPNYQEGLKNIKSVGQELNLDMHVYGPEMHVSGIVPLALVPGRLAQSKVEEFRG